MGGDGGGREGRRHGTRSLKDQRHRLKDVAARMICEKCDGTRSLKDQRHRLKDVAARMICEKCDSTKRNA